MAFASCRLVRQGRKIGGKSAFSPPICSPATQGRGGSMAMITIFVLPKSSPKYTYPQVLRHVSDGSAGASPSHILAKETCISWEGETPVEPLNTSPYLNQSTKDASSLQRHRTYSTPTLVCGPVTPEPVGRRGGCACDDTVTSRADPRRNQASRPCRSSPLWPCTDMADCTNNAV